MSSITENQAIDRELEIIGILADYNQGVLIFVDSEGTEFNLSPCPEQYQVRIDRSVNFSDYQLDPDNPNQLIFDQPLTVSKVGFFEENTASVFKGNTRLLALQKAFAENLSRFQETGSTEGFWIFPVLKLEFLTEQECSNPEYLFTTSRLDNQVAEITVRDKIYQVCNYLKLQKNLNPEMKSGDLKIKTAKYFRISAGTIDLYQKILGLISDNPEINQLVETKQLSVTSVPDFYKAYDSFIAQYPTESLSLAEFVSLCQSQALISAAEQSTIGVVPLITGEVIREVLEGLKPQSQESLVDKDQEKIEDSEKEKKASTEKLERERIKTLTIGQLAVEFSDLSTTLQDEMLPLMDLNFNSLEVENAEGLIQAFIADRLSALKNDLTTIYSQSEAKLILRQASKLKIELEAIKSNLYKQVELFESFFDPESPKYLKTSEQRKLDRKAKKEESLRSAEPTT